MAEIFAPQRRSIVSSIPLTTGPAGTEASQETPQDAACVVH
jgi:hypothetical protein